MNMVRTQEAVESFKTFEVVHVLNRPTMFNKSEAPVVVSMKSVQDKCVLVSPCVCTRRPPAPVDFPCQIAIAVGITLHEPLFGDNFEERAKQDRYKENEGLPSLHVHKNPANVDWQSCGSTLDFVCYRQYGDIEINNPWEASYFVTAITALILVKAYALGKYCKNSFKFENTRRREIHREFMFASYP